MPQPHDGAGAGAGAAQPHDGAGAGAAQPHDGAGAGAGAQQTGARAGAGAQQTGAGAGAGQHDGAGALHLLAIFALTFASNPPPWQPASFLACSLAKMPSRPPQLAVATEPTLLRANAANANDANRTLII
jgi:hypothetical protein